MDEKKLKALAAELAKGLKTEAEYFTVTEARNIPVSNSVGCYRAMVSEPAWVMWVRVGIMPLLSDSLEA